MLCSFVTFISSIKLTLLESDELKLELKSISGDNTEKENISFIFELMSNSNKYWVTTTLISLNIICIIFIYMSVNLLISDYIKRQFLSFFHIFFSGRSYLYNRYLLTILDMCLPLLL